MGPASLQLGARLGITVVAVTNENPALRLERQPRQVLASTKFKKDDHVWFTLPGTTCHRQRSTVIVTSLDGRVVYTSVHWNDEKIVNIRAVVARLERLPPSTVVLQGGAGGL